MSSYAQEMVTTHNIFDISNAEPEEAWWKQDVVVVPGRCNTTDGVLTFETEFRIPANKGRVVFELISDDQFQLQIAGRPVHYSTERSFEGYYFQILFICSVPASWLEGGYDLAVLLSVTITLQLNNIQTLVVGSGLEEHKWDVGKLVATKEGNRFLKDFCQQAQPTPHEIYEYSYGPELTPVHTGVWPQEGILDSTSPTLSEDSDYYDGSVLGVVRNKESSQWMLPAPEKSYASRCQSSFCNDGASQTFTLSPERNLIRPFDNINAAGDDQRVFKYQPSHLREYRINDTLIRSDEGISREYSASPLLSSSTSPTPAPCEVEQVPYSASPRILDSHRKRLHRSSIRSLSSRSSCVSTTSDVDSAIYLRSARNSVSPEDYCEEKHTPARYTPPQGRPRPHKRSCAALETPVLDACGEKVKPGVELPSYQEPLKHTMPAPENTQGLGQAAITHYCFIQSPRVYAPEKDDEVPLPDHENNVGQGEQKPVDNFGGTCEGQLDLGSADSPTPTHWNKCNTSTKTEEQAMVTLFCVDVGASSKGHIGESPYYAKSLPSPIESPTPAQSPLMKLDPRQHMSLTASTGQPSTTPSRIPILCPHIAPSDSVELNRHTSKGSSSTASVPVGFESAPQEVSRNFHTREARSVPMEGSSSWYSARSQPQPAYLSSVGTTQTPKNLARRTSVSTTDSSISPNSTPAKSDKPESPSTALTTPQAVSDIGNAAEALPTSTQGTDSGLPPNVFSRTSDHSRIWIAHILPWVNDHFESILGEENAGAIEFLLVGPGRTPTVCVTAEDESKVNRSFLKSELDHLNPCFDIQIQRGEIGRTSGGSGQAPGYIWPALNGKFQPQPSCGASIGVGDSTGSFGGLVQLKFGNEWRVFGLTSHHLFEDRTKKTPIGEGVKNGRLRGTTFEISQPSKHHLNHSIDILKRSLYSHDLLDKDGGIQFSPAEKQRRANQRQKIAKKLEDQDRCNQDRCNQDRCNEVYFGMVEFSSGFGRTGNLFPDSLSRLMGNTPAHTMDWALFGNIPHERLMQGNCVTGGLIDSYYEAGDPIFSTVSQKFFNGLEYDVFKCRNPEPDVSPPEPCCKVHGVGSMTGLQDGYMSTVPGCIKLEKFGKSSIEWSFAPRYRNGLGRHGDSGAWIFDNFGSVVGMVLGCNSHMNLTYFTPIDLVFADIKEVTGAQDVRLAEHPQGSREAFLSHELEGTGGAGGAGGDDASCQREYLQPLAIQTPVAGFMDDTYNRSTPEPWNQLMTRKPLSDGIRCDPSIQNLLTPGTCTPNSQRTFRADSAIAMPPTPITTVGRGKRKMPESGDEHSNKRPKFPLSQVIPDNTERMPTIKKEPVD